MPSRRQTTDLKAAIAAKGYNWVAAPNPISQLAPAERRAHLGLVVTDAELKATAEAIRSAARLRALQAVAAPAAVDWRNNGGDWTTPIRDQQSCGSCVSFATCATIESRVKLACRNATLSPDLSEAHAFYCGCGNCCGTGWNFPPALDFAKNTGIAREADFPYTPANQACPPNLQPWVKITAWSAVLAVADRKATLASKGPMVAGMAVYSDFFSYRSGVYRHVTGGLEGYHAVSVVGYDDAQQCWIAKNSWGTGWGDGGWFRIGYGEAQMDTSFAFYDVDAPCPAPPPDDCQRYLPYLSRVIQAARGNAALKACLRYYVCRLGPRPLCSANQLAVVRSVLTVLRACPRYHQPFCRALR